MKKTTRVFVVGAGAVILAGLFVFGMVFWYLSATLPRIITTADYRPAMTTQFVMRDGAGERTVAEFYKERRYVIPFEKIPKIAVQAFVAAEDDRFFEHQGISWVAIARAAVTNFLAGHVVQGGSTITQQVVKSLFLSPERNLLRKVKEAILAGRIEKNLNKQQILYLYLNQIYLGHGAYGLQAAARVYYHKDANQLALPEVALLAGMPRAPGRCSPLQNAKCAKDRQLYVLKRMQEVGFISKEDMQKAATSPLRVFLPAETQEKKAAYIIEHVRRYIAQKYGDKALYEDGLRVELPSTLDNYDFAENSVREGLRQVDKRKGYRGPVKKLTKPEEVTQFQEAQREALFKKKAPFVMLMPDGRVDSKETSHTAGIQSDEQLLQPGEIYQAVVSRVDDAKRSIYVDLLSLQLQIPYAGLSWILNGKDPKVGPLSKHFEKGDVIWVKLSRIMSRQAAIGELEQVPDIQGALLSLEARTGYVLAMIGGYDPEKSEFNRATQAERQAGSSFKPVIYACGLENGYTPASILVDAPLVYDDEESGKWRPSNYENRFSGDVSYRQALIKSMNIPTIKIVQSMKVPTVINYARKLGITSDFKQDLSISLGSATFSLLELSQVYSLFPRLGRKVTPIFVKRVLDRDGRVLEENLPKPLPAWVVNPDATNLMPALPPIGPAAAQAQNQAAPSVAPVAAATAPSPAASPAGASPGGTILADDPDQVMDPRIAFMMTHLMKEVVEFGTGMRAKALGRPVAGKTGTTNDYRDAWFMGYTPYVVTGTWVGYDDQQTLGSGETGSAAAIPIWLDYMKEVTQSYPGDEFIMPRGVTYAWIDQKTGKLTAPGAPGAVREAFLDGTAPTESVGQGDADTGSDSEFLKEELE